MIEDHVLFQPDEPTIEFDTSIHFFKNKMLYFKREFYSGGLDNLPQSQLVLYQYDFQQNKESIVQDEKNKMISKIETDEMRFYNRFSKEFGHHDVSSNEGDHSTDHICSSNFYDVMGKIFLSMIPYQLNKGAIDKIRTELNQKGKK